jgi:hypothetical protein
MTTAVHSSLFADAPEVDAVVDLLRRLLLSGVQPSPWELLQWLDERGGLKACWAVGDALKRLALDPNTPYTQTEYINNLLESEDWARAVRGGDRPGREVESTIDALIRESANYLTAAAFQEMISFMANFRDYSPFNNMLVKLQRPSCSLYATQKDWKKRFARRLKTDARPMVILAPMHPVMLVFELDSTEGPPLPQTLQEFSRFEGKWDPKRLQRTTENASTHDLIQIEPVTLSSTNSGFATISGARRGMKMRIAIHDKLDEPSRYGVLLHELAHIYLGHLRSDTDGWWPSRGDLDRRAMEVEAEAVAYIVSQRAGLQGSSSQYVSQYIKNDFALRAISLDMIAKVAGRLDEMGTRVLPKRKLKVRARNRPRRTAE